MSESEHTQQVLDEDAEQIESWSELSLGAGAVAKIAPSIAEAAGGEAALGVAGTEAAGLALETAMTTGAIGVEGGIALAGGAIGEGALLAGGAVAAEVAGVAAFAAVAAPVVAIGAAAVAIGYGLDYVTDGAISDGLEEAGEAVYDGAEAVGEAVYDGAEAVGDAVGDAWDWVTGSDE